MAQIPAIADELLCLDAGPLRLRPLQADDLDLALEMFTDPAVMEHLAPPDSPENIAKGMPTWVQRGAGGRLGTWCILDAASGEKLGTSVLLPVPIDVDDTDWSQVRYDRYPDVPVEVGYILKRSAWGRGVATAACRAITRFGFTHTPLDTLIAVTEPANAVSQTVLGKCGFTLLGRRRAYATEVCWFEQTRADWAAADDKKPA